MNLMPLAKRSVACVVLVLLSACERTPEPPNTTNTVPTPPVTPVVRTPEVAPTPRQADVAQPQDKKARIRWPLRVEMPPIEKAQDRYFIEPSVREEYDAEGKPQLICEGTTDAPEGAVFMINVYRTKVDPGRQLSSRAVQVNDGKFTTAPDFSLFREYNMPGSYVFEVAFDPDFQPVEEEIVERIKKEGKDKEVKVVFSIQLGTREDHDREFRRVRQKLADEFEAVQKVLETALADWETAGDVDTWKTRAEAYKEKAREIEARNVRLPEYHYFELADIAESEFEPVRDHAWNLVEFMTRALEGHVSKEQIKSSFENFKQRKRALLVKMGVTRASEIDVDGIFGAIRHQMNGMLGIYKDARAGVPLKDDIELVAKSHLREIRKLLLQVAHSVPPQVYAKVVEAQERIETFYSKAVEWMPDNTKDRTRQLEEALEDLDKRVAEIKEMVKHQ